MYTLLGLSCLVIKLQHKKWTNVSFVVIFTVKVSCVLLIQDDEMDLDVMEAPNQPSRPVTVSQSGRKTAFDERPKTAKSGGGYEAQGKMLMRGTQLSASDLELLRQCRSRLIFQYSIIIM